MRRAPTVAVLFLGALAALGCRPAPHAASDKPCYAATTSWIECCLRDVAGSDIAVVRVCPPGTCPGHFDLAPGVLGELQKSNALFCFDFQQGLRDKLAGSCRVIKAIPAPKGLCVPERYLAGCEAVCQALSELEPGKAAAFRASLDQVRARLAALETELRGKLRAAPAVDAKVLASRHQEAFCRWLDLDVVGTFAGADAVTPSEFSALATRGREAAVCLVVANKQEGSTVADSVARELGVPVVVFSNFPSMDTGQQRFDELVQANVAGLVKALAGRHP